MGDRMLCKSPNLTMIAVLILGTCAASARSPVDVTTTFYADAAKTQWVGEIELTCGGGIIKFGHRSPFSTQTSDSCLPGRMSQSTLSRFKGVRFDRVAACRNACVVRFYKGLGFCSTNDCPERDALNDCLSGCDGMNGDN